MTWYLEHDIIWYDMKYDMTWYDISHMTQGKKYDMVQDNITWHIPCHMWHDMIWHEMAWHKWNDMKLHVRMLCFVPPLTPRPPPPPLSYQHKSDHCISWKSEHWCMLCNIQPCLASSGGSESYMGWFFDPLISYFFTEILTDNSFHVNWNSHQNYLKWHPPLQYKLITN